MAQNPEDENVLDQARAIFEESKQETQPLHCSLPTETFLGLSSTLIFIKYHLPKKAAERELAESLVERYYETLGESDPTVDKQGAIVPDSIAFDLNIRETDLIIQQLMRQIGNARQIGNVASRPTVKDIAFGSISNSMACLVSLHTEWIRAGGQPRPEFVRFREGVEPSK